MDSILVQKQIRDNAEDLRSYLQELKSWESEMKRKECDISSASSSSQQHPPVRSKIKKLAKGEENTAENKCNKEKKKPEKISGFDYASWDKFDVDKACEDLDEEGEKECEDNSDAAGDVEMDRRREEALYEKEKGNDFVKRQKWKDAIQCYNRAIKSYPNDAIFYANRALCYLKLLEYKSAEADCTAALQLDTTYVKAYQRRAAARVELGQLTEARADLLQVLKIEPSNKISRAELIKVEKLLNHGPEQKIKSTTEHEPILAKSSSNQSKTIKMVTIEKSKKEIKEDEIKKSPDVKSKSILTSDNEKITELEKQSKCVANSDSVKVKDEKIQEQELWPAGDLVKLVQPIYKPPHLRSKKPLKRITIYEIDNLPLENTNEPSPDRCNVSEEAIRIKSQTNDSPASTEQKDVSTFSELKPIDTKQESTKVTSEEKSQTSESSAVREQQKDISNIFISKPISTKQVSTKVTSEEKTIPNQDKTHLQFSTDITVDEVPPQPTTSVQFYVAWNKIKSNPQLSYRFLKQISGTEFPQIFRESLESGVLSDIINIIKTMFLQKKEPVLPYVVGLTKVRRFGALVMFLSEDDKKGIKEILQYCKEQEECTQDELIEIMKLYELC